MARHVSACCKGERCHCGAPAEHKVEETIFDDDPTGWMLIGVGTRAMSRHPLTSYICHAHFREIMGPMADREFHRATSGTIETAPKDRDIELHNSVTGEWVKCKWDGHKFCSAGGWFEKPTLWREIVQQQTQT